MMELGLSKKCLNWGFLFFPELGIFEGRQERQEVISHGKIRGIHGKAFSREEGKLLRGTERSGGWLESGEVGAEDIR